MNLYLIRHADALALGERGITDDAARPLSTKGETQSGLIGKTLHRKGITFDRVVTSPYVRARQTTDLLLEAWNGNRPDVQVAEALIPDAKPRKLAKFLRRLGGEEVAVVGHLPHIAHWAGWLIGAPKGHFEMVKAGVAMIVCGSGARKGLGVLQWLVTPDWFE